MFKGVQGVQGVQGVKDVKDVSVLDTARRRSVGKYRLVYKRVCIHVYRHVHTCK